ncbi:uncharacterized protein METZ01_LOCUS474072, partial [marine metagenome]
VLGRQVRQARAAVGAGLADLLKRPES